MNGAPARSRGGSGLRLALALRDLLALALLTAATAAVGGALTAVALRVRGPLAPLVLVLLVGLPALVLLVLARPALGVAGLALVFPIGVRHLTGGVEIVQVAIVALVALVALRRLHAGHGPLVWAGPLWWLLALLGWSALSLPSAASRSLAVRAVAGLSLELLLVAAVLGACTRVEDVRRVVAVLVAVAAVVGLTAPAGASQARAAFAGSVISGRAVGFFSQANELGTFTAVGALLGAALALGARTSRGRGLALLGAGGAALGLTLSLSRGAWIGFTCGVIALLAMVPQARRAVLALALPLIALAAALGAFAPSSPQVQVVGARVKSIAGEHNPYDNRPAIWADARRLILARPVLGFGPGSYPVVSVTATSDARPTFAEHAHNIFLTWGVEAGIPAAAAILGLTFHLAALVRRARAKARAARRRREASLLSGVAAALVAVLAQGMFDYTLRNSVIYTTVFLVLGVLLCLIRQEAAASPAVVGMAASRGSGRQGAAAPA